jgi:regulator of ribosome biosynthesis
VILPNETYVLPRAAKVPEPKPETTWEKFAKEKGITKKKRERMVYDENNEEYRPRFGYKRANSGIDEIPIVEVKKGQDPFADPWAEAKNDKKNRGQEQELR